MQLQFPFLTPQPPAPPPVEDHVVFVRMRRAKRYILRVRPDGSLRITIPRGGSRAEALAFARTQSHWIEQERLRVHEHRAAVPPEREVELRKRAAEQLIPRLHDLAAQHGLTVTRATIRNQRTRWGSCSRRGAIALNYRLMLMPPWVADYVLIHELMHLREQNHGRRFWRHVAQACPEFREAERWLRTNGRTLF